MMPFYFGLDLGQAQDFSACIILDVQGERDEQTYDARYIEQFPLGTSYPSIVSSVGTLLDRAPLAGDCQLIIDHTGVGRPLFDMFVNDLRKPLGITITGGTQWHEEDYRQWHVSKIMLVSTVQRVLQSGRLRIGAKLSHASTLQAELRNFRVRISKAAHETYDAREGAHDDLVLALAVALFAGEHHAVAVGLSVAEIRAELVAAGHPLPPEQTTLRTIGPRQVHDFKVGDRVFDAILDRGVGTVGALGRGFVFVRWDAGGYDWVEYNAVTRDPQLTA